MTHQQAVQSMAAERYLLDEMSELERHRFEEHYFDCGDCAEEVRIGAVVREEVRAAGPSVPAIQPRNLRIVPARARNLFTVVMPWAAAAALALFAGYQALVLVPDLRSMATAQAVSPVVLRQATRGPALPTVTLPDSGGFVAVAPDVDTRGVTGPIPYRLQRADGTHILSDRADVGAPGQPLVLLLPAKDVRQPGEYVLIIDIGGTPEEYHFQVAAR